LQHGLAHHKSAMSETDQEAKQASTTPPSTGKSGGMLIKIIALLFVVAVIFAECLIAFLFLGNTGQAQQSADPSNAPAAEDSAPPSAPSEGGPHDKATASHNASPHSKPDKHKGAPSKEGTAKGESGKQGHGGKKSHGSGGHGTSGDSGPNDLVEMDLERFVVTAYQPNSSTVMRVDFHLFGMVASKDREEFERLMEIHQHRFREQVLVIVRRAEAADLADPGLGLIKRQILEKTNALLGKPLLQAVVVSDFSYLEQ